MAIVFKTPDEIADEYLTHLKSLKPEINKDQDDSDWFIRSRVVGGVISGLYADQRKVSDDGFPQSARRDAIERMLYQYFDEGFRSATESVGDLLVSGATGTLVPAGTEFLYEPNGNTYQSEEDVTLDAATAVVPVQSVGTGQTQNLLEGAELTISSPPAGLDPTATVFEAALSDGKDAETVDEAAARILARIRNPIAGGKETDYQQWAIDADDSVVSASVIRYPFGLGSVAVYISSGTTDIDAAIDAGDPIVQIPSDDLIEIVQDYIDAQKPITDCALVLAPSEVEIDVTVRVRYLNGDGDTIPSGETLTQEELVQREIRRAIYKTPVGGRRFGDSGYVVASEIEEVIDNGLSASPHTIGELEILTDRQVDDLAGSGANRLVLGNEVPTPGTITVIDLDE